MGTGGVILLILFIGGGVGIALLLTYATGGLGPTGAQRKAAAETEARYQSGLQQLKQGGFVFEKSYPPMHTRPWLFFDYGNNRFAYFNNNAFGIYFLDRVIECSLIQDGTIVHKDAVAPAMVGAAVFGLGGAIAGATAMHGDAQVGILAVRILMDDLRSPSVMFTVLSTSLDKNSPAYLSSFQQAQELYGIFEGVVRYNRTHKADPAASRPFQAEAPLQHQPQAQQAQNGPFQQFANGSSPQPPNGLYQQVPQAADSGNARCAQCNAALPYQAKFCNACGTKVAFVSAKTAEQLSHLEQLRNDGILTAQEFEEKKAFLMERG